MSGLYFMLAEFLEYIVIGIALLALVSLVIAIFAKKSAQTQGDHIQSDVETNHHLISDLQQQLVLLEQTFAGQIDELKAQLLEEEQVSKHLELRIKSLQEKLQQQTEQLQMIQSQAPENRLYTRAQKMVALGADVEELMDACELPRAEAELIFAMHKK